MQYQLQKNYRPIYARINQAGRIKFFDYHEDMWKMVCKNDGNRYAVLQSEYIKMENIAPCELLPVGQHYFKTWIVSGINKDFKYTSFINKGYIPRIIFKSFIPYIDS